MVDVYTQETLPGGPWRTYRPRTRVTAVRMPGPFELIAADGTTTPVQDGWIVLDDDVATGVEAGDFAEQYEAADPTGSAAGAQVADLEAAFRATTATGPVAAQLRDQLHAAVDSIRAQMDARLATREALRVIATKANADITARDTKDVARYAIDTIGADLDLSRSVVALARLAGLALDSADTGSTT